MRAAAYPKTVNAKQSDNGVRVLSTATSCSKATFTKLLVLSKPWFLGLAQDTLGAVVNEMSENDENKSNGVEIVDVVTQDLSTNNDSPEGARQQTNVEESSRAHAEDDRCQGVEDEQQQSVANNVANDFSVPMCFLNGVAVENGSLDAVDKHSPECELTNNFVHGSFRDQELFKRIAETVESLSEQTEKISLESVNGRVIVAFRNVIT